MIGAEPRGKGTKVLHYNSRLGLIGQKPAYPSSLCPGHTAQAHCTWIQISGYCGPSEGAVGLCLFFCSELCPTQCKNDEQFSADSLEDVLASCRVGGEHEGVLAPRFRRESVV